MNNYSWSTQSANSRGVEDSAAIGEKYLRTLDALGHIDPVLKGWIIWDSNCSLEELEAWADAGALEPAPVRPIPLEQARGDMTALVEANVHRDDWDEPQPDEGYSLVANNGPDPTARSVCVSVTAGSEFNYNQWSVMFGDPARIPPDPALMTYPIMDGLFRTMTSIWPTPWAKLSGSVVDYEERPGIVGTTNVETFRHDITWMGYLSAECAPGFEPPADLISERTADGGLLLISAEERPDPANADQMRRSDLLTAIMDKYCPT
jgi:hypothetical protein